MKGLASDRNNAYLVNVAVTNVATGEVATYEVPPPLPAFANVTPHSFQPFHLVCFVTPSPLPPPHQVLTIQNETPVYKPPEVSAQDYAVIIGVCVTVFVR